METRETGARPPLDLPAARRGGGTRERRAGALRFGAIGGAALLAAGTATAADHRDSPSLDPLDTTSPTANPDADLREDINDIYAFMNPNDAEELVLVMTVFRDAGPDTTFSTEITHDFLIESSAGPNTAAVGSMRLSCVFPSVAEVSCSLGDVVAASPVGELGQTLPDDGMRVYAGLREDPFFFNGPGLNRLLPEGDEFATMAAGDPATIFAAAADANGGVADDFAGENTLAIVVGVDRDLLTADQAAPVLKIWAATAPR